MRLNQLFSTDDCADQHENLKAMASNNRLEFLKVSSPDSISNGASWPLETICWLERPSIPLHTYCLPFLIHYSASSHSEPLFQNELVGTLRPIPFAGSGTPRSECECLIVSSSWTPPEADVLHVASICQEQLRAPRVEAFLR